MILAFVCLTLLSFKLLWWVLLAGLILLLLIGVSFVLEARMGWISTLFAVLILVAVFIVFGTPKSLQSAVPVEIALGVRPSWSITSDVILSNAKNFLVGSGFGTFGVDFSKFRTADFNNDQFAWSLRFNQPFSSLLALPGRRRTGHLFGFYLPLSVCARACFKQLVPFAPVGHGRKYY